MNTQPYQSIGKQSSVRTISLAEYACYAQESELWIYNLDGEFLDVLAHSPCVYDDGTPVNYEDALMAPIILVLDIKDPGIYEYLGELMAEQRKVRTIKKCKVEYTCTKYVC